MNKLLNEVIQPITSVLGQAFTGAATTVNGSTIFLDNVRKALVRFTIGNAASTDNDITVSVLENDGTTTRNVGNAVSTPNVVFERVADGCIPNATAVELTLVTVAAADVVTINGVTFTAVDGATDLDENEFDQRGSDTQDAVELVLCINNALPNLIATNDAGVVTVRSRIPGAETITVTDINDITNIVPVTIEASAIIEIDASALSDGYDRIIPRALTGGVAAATTLAVTATVGDARYRPLGQQVTDDVVVRPTI